MKCEEALLLIDAVLDGEADHEEEQLLRFHLNGCASCRRVMLFNRSISGKVAELDEPDPPEGLLEAVSARLASGSYDRSPLPGHSKFFSGWKIAAVIPFAAAALLLVRGGSADDPPRLAEQAPAVAEETVDYTPAPMMAYSRPSSVTTF